MNKKYIYLITAIVSILCFIGFMGESGPKSLLGISVNIWIYRLIWLGFGYWSFKRYLSLKKIEQE